MSWLQEKYEAALKHREREDVRLHAEVHISDDGLVVGLEGDAYGLSAVDERDGSARIAGGMDGDTSYLVSGWWSEDGRYALAVSAHDPENDTRVLSTLAGTVGGLYELAEIVDREAERLTE